MIYAIFAMCVALIAYFFIQILTNRRRAGNPVYQEKANLRHKVKKPFHLRWIFRIPAALVSFMTSPILEVNGLIDKGTGDVLGTIGIFVGLYLLIVPIYKKYGIKGSRRWGYPEEELPHSAYSKRFSGDIINNPAYHNSTQNIYHNTLED